MFSFLRRLLCWHSYFHIHTKAVRYSGDEGSFIAVDMAKSHVIKHVEIAIACKHCGAIKVKRIKR